MVGPGASVRLAEAIADFGHRRVLIVTDSVVSGLGLLVPLTRALKAARTPFVVFDAVTADAPIPQVEAGIELFNRKHCDAIIACGGGSVMDAAKVIGLAAANKKHPRELVGYFKALRGPTPLYAVPTTAGTGSEVTVAAVISDPADGSKLVIKDTRIVPDMAALDPTLMTGLPAHVTAATGMDALTHAVEAYLSEWRTEGSDRMALAAVSLIYRHLPVAFRDGGDLVAREKMALAATYAGLAFTRANVGNVHAIAHQLGGRYHTPHGLANAIMLPPVLHFCAASVTARLAQLAVRSGVGTAGQDEKLLAGKFIKSVEAMNATLGIPRHLDTLVASDIPALAEAACGEADMEYPVPQRMTEADCARMLRAVLAPAHTSKSTRRKPSASVKKPTARRKAPSSGAPATRQRN
jgi:alcohol dehydrogenase class IV